MRCFLLLALVLSGCASAPTEATLEVCLTESDTADFALLDAVALTERTLLDTGVLTDRSRDAYRALVARIERGEPVLSFDKFCEGRGLLCDRLSGPSSTAAFVVCPSRIAEPNPLADVSRWAEQHGDIGPAYLTRVLDALDDRAFEDIRYRGALIQPIAVMASGSAPVGGSWNEDV